jgi:predicted aldo/keto reductase-like oxidoreductase
MVKTFPFADIHVPSPGFGAMGLSHGLGSNLSLEEAEPVLLKAIELGCTFWDTAVSSLELLKLGRILIKREGCLPSRYKREASWRIHQEA